MDEVPCVVVYQLMSQAISGSISDNGPPFGLDDIMGALNVQLTSFGLSQAKEPSYHHTYDAIAVKNCSFLQVYGKLAVANILSK